MTNTETLSIKAIRINLGLKAEELAGLIGTSVGRYRRIETYETPMYAAELVILHSVSGVPYDKIRIHK